MPRGTAFDLETFKTIKAKTVKKEGEETLEVWKPATGKRFRLLGFTLFSSVEAIITLKDEATVFMLTAVGAKAQAPIPLPQSGYLSVKEGNKLNLETSAEGAITATFYGVEDIA